MKLIPRFLALALTALPAKSAVMPERVAQIAALLPAAPAGLGAPATDRTIWATAARSLPVAEVLAAASRAAREPVPALPDDLFLEYSRNGNRTRYQQPNKQRLDRLNLFAWAEALEHSGRFVPALERELAAILEEKTWVLPAHDPKLDNFTGRETGVDLGAAMRGWTVATVLAWHADQLAPATVARIRAELRRRVIAPFLTRLHGQPSPDVMWWYQADNHWNAGCHAGIVGVALAVVASRTERAEILAQAEVNLQSYLEGFTPDGYCSEGVGYWNYGFGHFVMLAETVAEATGGRLRLMAGERAAQAAAYPANLEIIPGIYPAFADMNVKERPSPWFGALAARLLSPVPAGLPRVELHPAELRDQLLYESALKVFGALTTTGQPPAAVTGGLRDHHWFADAQVYTGRAAPAFGAAIKGGHNAEHHNHNDLGSWVVAVGHTAVLVDPGLEVYTARTFGPDRYVSKVLNSYGHAVPVVAGQLQQAGRQYAAKMITVKFSPTADTLVFDLAGGYAVPSLEHLTRTFTLRRGAAPSVTVTDSVGFTSPASFGTALITFEAWREISPGLYEIGPGTDRVRGAVMVEGAGWVLQPEVIQEDLPDSRRPTRLGFNLIAPVRTASIRLTITRP